MLEEGHEETHRRKETKNKKYIMIMLMESVRSQNKQLSFINAERVLSKIFGFIFFLQKLTNKQN